MRAGGVAIWITVLLGAPGSTLASTRTSTGSVSFLRRLTRAQLLALAAEQSPELAATRARRAAAAGALSVAGRWLHENPKLDVKLTGDAHPGVHRLEVELSQRLELAGQPGLREAQAAAELALAEAEAARLALELRLEITALHREALRAQELAELSGRALGLARALAVAAEQRLRAGDIGALDRELAAFELGRAEASHVLLLADWSRRTAALAGRVGLPRDGLALATEAPPALPRASLAELSERARRHRPDLMATQAEGRRAAAEGELAARALFPAPELGLGYERESSGTADEHLFTVGLGLELPLWDQRRAERARAAAEVQAQGALEQGILRRADGEVGAAHAALSAQLRALAALEALRPALERTLGLYERAYTQGELDLLGVLAARDRVLAAERERIELAAECAGAAAELERAVGEALE